jgi:murein DD-endopeptidase MepM/ murein hydrolase activator NlpD
MPEPSREDAGPPHRPLPSVGVPLLAHERRAERLRWQLSLAGAVLLGVLLIAGLMFSPSWRGGAAEPDPSTLDAAGPDALWPSEGGRLTAAAAPQPAAVAAAPDAAAAAAVDEPGSESGLAAPPGAELLAAEVAEELAPLGTIPDPHGPSTVTKPFGTQSKGFRDALRRAGASPEEADGLVDALSKLMDFRRCRPEQQLTFVREADGALSRFEYQVSITELYRATRKQGFEYTGSKVEVPLELRRISKGGRVAGSLGQALEALGLRNSLAGVFVEVFEGRIDFKKHTRAGDSFRLVVDEQYVEGEFLGYGNVQAIEYAGERAGSLRAYWYEPQGDHGDYYGKDGRAMHGGWLRTPLRYDHISSPYNLRRRHPVLKRIMPHNGIDYAAAPGTSVSAAADGEVTFAGERGANGNLIAIRHAGGFETFYAHLLRINRGIKPGAKVKQRQPIGAVGTTGRSTGPHLHFALKRGGRFIDPASQLNGPGKPLPNADRNGFKNAVRRLDAELERIALAAAPSGPVAPEPEPAVEEFHEDALDL